LYFSKSSTFYTPDAWFYYEFYAKILFIIFQAGYTILEHIITVFNKFGLSNTVILILLPYTARHQKGEFPNG
jgi:hypothetical protein